MIRVKSYNIPPKGFAPYNYVLKHIPDLHERYAELARNIGSKDDLQTPDFGPLTVHICWNTSGQKPVDIKEVISKRAFPAAEHSAESNYSCLEHFLRSTESNPTGYVSLVLNEDIEGVGEISTSYKNIVFFMMVDDRSKLERKLKQFRASDDSDCNVYYTSKELIHNDIGDLLERKVLQCIKTKCENVSIWLSEKKRLDLAQKANTRSITKSRKRKALVVSDSKIQNVNLYQRSCSETSNGLADPSRECPVLKMLNMHNTTTSELKGSEENDNHKLKVGKDVQFYCTDAHLKLERLNLDSTERLLAEMLALYSTSNVPEQDRPNTGGCQSRPISEKVKSDIFDSDPTVIGMGYCFSRFVIHIAQTEKRKANRNGRKRIEEILDKHGIEDYKIEVVSKDFQSYGFDVSVGSRLMTSENVFVGTLGCFANMKKNNDCKPCALLAKHVATCSDQFKCLSDQTDDTKPLGSIFKDTVTETGLDIAAMILESDIKFCAQFRVEEDDIGEANDEDINTLQGKLYRYIEDQKADERGILRDGQKVYIWGAKSNPGKGVISSCKYKFDDMKALIVIEDRAPVKAELCKRFCDPGDSGAIVCAEDSRGRFVHIVGMLMGVITKTEEFEVNLNCTGKYLALPLSSGLEELEERTKHNFELLECIDP